jgi:hypothetical protein
MRLLVVVIALSLLSCSKKESPVIDFKSKVIGHWYCIMPDSSYDEIIFTDSAFIAQGIGYGTMFRRVKYVSPDSIYIYDDGVLSGKMRVSFYDSVMSSTYGDMETKYFLISRLNDVHYQLLFKGNKQAKQIFDLGWRNHWGLWEQGLKIARWGVKDRTLTDDEKKELLSRVNDSFVKAMLVADTAYINSTVPLFRFFDADFDNKDEIAFSGTAGASDEFFKMYTFTGSEYTQSIYEIGRMIDCTAYRDTTWIVLYRPLMIGDEGVDSVVTYSIGRNFKKRISEGI